MLCGPLPAGKRLGDVGGGLPFGGRSLLKYRRNGLVPQLFDILSTALDYHFPIVVDIIVPSVPCIFKQVKQCVKGCCVYKSEP